MCNAIHNASPTLGVLSPDAQSLCSVTCAALAAGNCQCDTTSAKRPEPLQGGVNDLALTRLDTQLIAVSGGSDATVKVWSATTSEMLFCFAGEPVDMLLELEAQG